MRRRVTAGIAAVFLSTAAVAADNWQAFGKWNLQLKPESCTIGRSLTDGQHQIVIAFLTEPLKDTFKLVIVAPPSLFSSQHGKVRVNVAGNDVGEGYLAVDGKAITKVRLLHLRFGRSLLPSLDQAPRINIAGSSTKLDVPIGGSSAVAAALDSCEKGLLTIWNVDPLEAEPAKRAKAIGSPAGWFSYDDYPREALDKGQQGLVDVIYRVSLSGRVDLCRVVKGSDVPLLDSTTCNILSRRATFEPAKDGAGHSVTSWQRLTMQWLVGGAGVRPIETVPFGNGRETVNAVLGLPSGAVATPQ